MPIRQRSTLTKSRRTLCPLIFRAVYQFNLGHVTAGASWSRMRGDGTTLNGEKKDIKADQTTLYVYATLAPASNAELTLGVSYDQADTKSVTPAFATLDDNLSQVNPKLGIRVALFDDFVLRAALFRTSKRDFVSDQTLEPTTIAGFAQFFDDFDWTDSWTAAAGADFRVTSHLWFGVEYIHRSLEIPSRRGNAPLIGDVETRSGEEHGIQGYANVTIGENLALTGGVQFSDNSTEALGRPGAVRSLIVPVGARYFLPGGFFGAAEAIWFDQTATELNRSDPSRATDQTGFLLNGVIGYRLPRNRGLLSLEVNNLLDRNFSLQNSLVSSSRPSTRPLAEELSVIARMTLSF